MSGIVKDLASYKLYPHLKFTEINLCYLEFVGGAVFHSAIVVVLLNLCPEWQDDNLQHQHFRSLLNVPTDVNLVDCNAFSIEN